MLIGPIPTCKNGHNLFGVNVRIRPKNRKICVPCARDYGKKWGARRREKAKVDQVRHLPIKGKSCKNGHPETWDSVRTDNRGRKYCRICWNLAAKKYREKRKQGVA